MEPPSVDGSADDDFPVSSDSVTGGGLAFEEAAGATIFPGGIWAPCMEYPFGTDFMGRDMFRRTVTGLSVSIRLGLLTAGVSAVIAFFLGLGAAVLGKGATPLSAESSIWSWESPTFSF